MDLSVHIVRFDPAADPSRITQDLVATATAIEEAGAASLSLMDHYFQIPAVGSAEDHMLEGYTSLGFLAARTSRVHLGLLVTGVMCRHPGLLVKIVTTLDVLSGGRAQLGVGAAWYEREHLGLGVPFPPLVERFERLEETLQICRRMWGADGEGPYEGKHYRLEEPLCSPRPISRPHPRILIGGTGERKTLRLVAKYGDACNLFAQSPEFVANKLDVLRRHCDEVGRDYDEISKTILYVGGALSEDRDAFLADMASYARLGISEVAVMPLGEPQAQWVESRCAPVVARLAEL